jgi:hypothetical protein
MAVTLRCYDSRMAITRQLTINLTPSGNTEIRDENQNLVSLPSMAEMQQHTVAAFDTNPIAKRLIEQMESLENGLASRMNDIVAANRVGIPNSAIDQLASMMDGLEMKNRMFRSNLDSIVPQSLVMPKIPVLPLVTPVSEHIKNATNVVADSVEQFAERVDRRMQDDAAATLAQMIHITKVMETLVGISIANSKENAASSRRVICLSVIMIIVGIGQCVPWLFSWSGGSHILDGELDA